MERIRFITYKDHKILYADHSGLDENGVIENIKSGSRFVIECTDTQILLLVDFRNTYGTEKVIKELKSQESIKSTKKIKKTAVLGISGVKKILLNFYNKLTKQSARAVNTMEEAQEYLISE